MARTNIRSILTLAAKLSREDPRTLDCASMTRQLCDTDPAPDNSGLEALARLAARIYDLMTVTDEPRYTLYDYADAVVHACDPVDISKLMSLDDEAFIAAMIWLATDRRKAYSDMPHQQPPLDIDIKA